MYPYPIEDDYELLSNLRPDQRADMYEEIAEALVAGKWGRACLRLSDIGLHELSDSIADACPTVELK